MHLSAVGESLGSLAPISEANDLRIGRRFVEWESRVVWTDNREVERVSKKSQQVLYESTGHISAPPGVVVCQDEDALLTAVAAVVAAYHRVNSVRAVCSGRAFAAIW